MGLCIYSQTEVLVNGTWHHYTLAESPKDYLSMELIDKHSSNPIPSDITVVTRGELGVLGSRVGWLDSEALRAFNEEGKSNREVQERYSSADWISFVLGDGVWRLLNDCALMDDIDDFRVIYAIE